MIIIDDIRATSQYSLGLLYILLCSSYMDEQVTLQRIKNLPIVTA